MGVIGSSRKGIVMQCNRYPRHLLAGILLVRLSSLAADTVARTNAGAIYEPGRDGQRFLVLTSPEAAQQSLNVIVNWPALLKRGGIAR